MCAAMASMLRCCKAVGSQVLYSAKACVVIWLVSSPRIFTPRTAGVGEACRALRRARKSGARSEGGTRMPSCVQVLKALLGSFMGDMYETLMPHSSMCLNTLTRYSAKCGSCAEVSVLPQGVVALKLVRFEGIAFAKNVSEDTFASCAALR